MNDTLITELVDGMVAVVGIRDFLSQSSPLALATAVVELCPAVEGFVNSTW